MGLAIANVIELECKNAQEHNPSIRKGLGHKAGMPGIQPERRRHRQSRPRLRECRTAKARAEVACLLLFHVTPKHYTSCRQTVVYQPKSLGEDPAQVAYGLR